MAKFSSSKSQAASVMKELQGDVIQSVRTVQNYEQSLKTVAAWSAENRIEGGLRGMTPELASRYLNERAESIGQSALNQERQAIQSMMQNVTGKLALGERLEVVKSKLQQAQTSRAYTREQVALVAQAQSDRNALATEIAHAAGLRAHELHTLRPVGERAADERPADSAKFSGRDGQIYTVEGKGGLCREVLIPSDLAARLEDRKLEMPANISDRGVFYTSHYDVGGGNALSSSFSAASERSLGWSEGLHGLRHSYAQERMSELQRSLTREDALRIVSQELGHFRSEITEVYLR
jgi:integrase